MSCQWTEAVKKRIAELHGKMVPVLNNMTHVFQPLDLTVNRSCKAHIRKSTHQCVTNEVQKQLESGKQPENVKTDTKLSIVNPLHAKCVTSFYDSMQTNKSIVTKGWDRAGITQFLKIDSALKQEDPFMMLQIELE